MFNEENTVEQIAIDTLGDCVNLHMVVEELTG